MIVDDNALARQGIQQNRDLTEREREAEKHGFSYVELDGDVGVVGNGAGLTMATLDLLQHYGLRAANFLDVGGGADRERVAHAVRLLASSPGVRVIIVNLLGGITRCDEVARGHRRGRRGPADHRPDGRHERGRGVRASRGARVRDVRLDGRGRLGAPRRPGHDPRGHDHGRDRDRRHGAAGALPHPAHERVRGRGRRRRRGRGGHAGQGRPGGRRGPGLRQHPGRAQGARRDRLRDLRPGLGRRRLDHGVGRERPRARGRDHRAHPRPRHDEGPRATPGSAARP